MRKCFKCGKKATLRVRTVSCDGVQAICKVCNRKVAANWFEENHDYKCKYQALYKDGLRLRKLPVKTRAKILAELKDNCSNTPINKLKKLFMG
jgi:hypothetical protein